MGSNLCEGYVSVSEVIVAVECERAPVLAEAELPCVRNVILLRPRLPLDLGDNLREGTSFFHHHLLGNGIAPEAATLADCCRRR
jgi:hypothetical protein